MAEEDWERRSLVHTTEPKALSARYDAQTELIVIHLRSGAIYSFPAVIGQGLSDASEEQLAGVEVTPAGDGLHWEVLDVDFTVKGLLAGIFGTQAWMTDLQKRWQ